MTPVLLAVSVALLVFGAVEATRFVFRYSHLWWSRTREGKHLMGFTRALAATLWATLLLNVLPLPLWVSLCIQVALLSWLDFELNRRNRLLTLNQRLARDIEHAPLYRDE